MKTLALVILALTAVSSPLNAANDPAQEKAVLATLDAMAKALEKIYGDDITYSHSSALNQTKDVVLKDLQGPSVAEFMKFSDTTVRIYGDVALVKGVCDFRNGQPGNLLDNHLNILWVMVKRAQGPYGWQIVARQTTRIGPSTGTPVSAKKP